MPFYGDKSDLRKAGRNVVLIETLLPIVLIILSCTFIALCIFYFGKQIPDIFNLEQDDQLLLLAAAVIPYGLIDLCLSLILCSAVTKLSPACCRLWIFLQLITLITFLTSFFVLIPMFLFINLDNLFWELLSCAILLCIYKCYRLLIIHLLTREIHEEGIIWKHQPIYE